MLLISLTAIIFLHPKILEFSVNLLLKILHQDTIKINTTYSNFSKIVPYYIFNWLISGGALFLLLKSFIDIPTKIIFFLPGMIGMGIMLGLFAFFTPAGIGVREWFFGLILSNFIPLKFALVLVIISRIEYVLAETLLYLSFVVITKMKSIKRYHKNL